MQEHDDGKSLASPKMNPEVLTAGLTLHWHRQVRSHEQVHQGLDWHRRGCRCRESLRANSTVTNGLFLRNNSIGKVVMAIRRKKAGKRAGKTSKAFFGGGGTKKKASKKKAKRKPPRGWQTHQGVLGCARCSRVDSPDSQETFDERFARQRQPVRHIEKDHGW